MRNKMIKLLKPVPWKPWPELAEMMKIAKKTHKLFMNAQHGLLLFPSELEAHWEKSLYRWNDKAWVLVPWRESVNRFEDIIKGYEEQKNMFLAKVKEEFNEEDVVIN